MDSTKLLERYFSHNLSQEINAVSKQLHIEADFQLLDAGSEIQVIPFVLTGSIKVFKVDESGKEILLYFIDPGETCAMTLSSCIANEKSKIKAVTEEATDLLLIPSDQLLKWIDRYPEMKHFLIKVYNQRFELLLDTIDTLAFHQLNDRIMDYLHKISKHVQSRSLEITHQTIANELGSTREAVSRVLKQLENEQRIRISRNKIELL